MKKIPDNAKKVFEGVLHDVYQWQQEMFDGSFSTFEMLRRRDAVTVLAVAGDKILINHEEQPSVGKFISLPAGDTGSEFFIEDAKRELLEETGYVSKEWKEWFSVDVLGYSKMVWNNHYYIAKDAVQQKDPTNDPGEKIEVQLISFEQLLELKDNPSFRNKDLIAIFQKASEDEKEKQKLKDLLGITT